MDYSVNHGYSRNRTTIRICTANSEALDYYLANEIAKGRVVVIKTVETETGQNMWNVLSKAVQGNNLSTIVTRKLIDPSMSRFYNLHNGNVCQDDISFLPQVNAMYQNIWGDPNKISKRQTWARIKKESLTCEFPQGSDMIILSTAATLTQTHDVELLTLDHDFIIFKDEIKERFNINVVNAGTIPKP